MATTSTNIYTPYRAKKCKFYVNGDSKFYGKEYVVNPKRTRNMDALMTELNERFRCPRPFTRICTPIGGHRIKDLDQLEDRGNYVAVPSERFKKIGYMELEPRTVQKGSQSPRNLNVKPVEHSRKWQSSGRIRKIPTDVTTIFVFRNGHDLSPPTRVTVTHQMVRYGWDVILDEIKGRLKASMNGAPKKLCSVDGHTVKDVSDLNNMESYVLVCTGDYRGFRKCNYGRVQAPFQASPRMIRKSNNYHGVKLAPLKTRNSPGLTGSDSSDYPNSTSTGSSEKSNKSRKQAEHRPRPPRVPKKEENQVFHAKPVKHKRTPENTKQVDLDKDEGGIFKAKQKNNETQDAEEVEESKDTKVDLPIDQVEAEEVEEEIEEENSKTYRKQRTATPKKRTPTPPTKSPSPRNETPEPKTDPKKGAL